MPAIQMARLNAQIAVLARHIMEPVAFTRNLQALFDHYAYRVYRSGQAVPPASLVPAYHIPRMVMVQLQNRLRPECLAHPSEILNLVDLLWHDPMLEPRTLAAYLLGQIPLQHSDRVIERIQLWGPAVTDRTVLRSLLEDGTLTLRQKASQRWLAVIQTWLDGVAAEQAMGVKALLPLIADPYHQNFPSVLKSVGPLLQSPPADLLSDLQDLLEVCVRRSPVETSYYLRQLMMISNNPGLTRLVRRVFSQLPPASQASLRSLLQSRET